ncbi:hypothetical protein GCM10011609_86260 [Lentzea pudingi]|uniref:Uncharacterized protein n=1 Tax=Lentzea pudingi TaxID=1789439 RepID=A0ABQ2ISP5_9PSEU|nr:hypothetical protein [Lentzea pudingi]GGN29325.1 hypothetical protein GCM10011609_86260 [Lentzea pudingi]
MTDLQDNWRIVRATGEALKYGSDGLKAVLLGLSRLIDEEPWREYVYIDGSVVKFKSFAKFVTSPKGLNATPARIRSLIASDVELLDKFDAALMSPQGEYTDPAADRAAEPVQVHAIAAAVDDSQHIELDETDKLVGDVHEVAPQRPPGNSRQAALRRLRKDAPEYHAKVIAGEMSTNRAMIDSGLRPPPPKVRVQKAASVPEIAAVLRSQLTTEELIELLKLLGS